MADPIAAFREAIEKAGIPPPEEIIADGRLHRYSTNDRAKDAAGWYKLHLDGIPSGAFGDWRRQDLGGTFSLRNGRAYSEDEVRIHQARIRELQTIRQQEADAAFEKMRELVAARWARSQVAREHAYTTAKGIRADHFRVDGDKLLVPVVRDGEMVGMQEIFATDEGFAKKFVWRSRVAGGSWQLGVVDGSGPIALCEGAATAVTIHERMGWAVSAAFSAGNMLEVGKALRRRLPDARIIVCADDDWRTDGNPGLKAATETAAAIGARLAVPPRMDDGNDWNDAACAGLDVAALLGTVLDEPDAMVALLESRFVCLAEHPETIAAPVGEWLIEGWQPRGIGFTYGTTGYLKSFAELWQAIAAAAGRDVLGSRVATPSGCLRTLILHTEDTAQRVHYDLNRMATRMALTPSEIAAVRDNLRIVPVPDLDMALGVREFGALRPSPAVDWIAELAIRFRADLVMLDTMSGMEPGGGDFGEKAMSILRAFYTIMAKAGCGVHALAHVSKEVTRSDLRDVGAILGSSLYGNKCRIARWVSKPSADEFAVAPTGIRDLQDRCAFHGEKVAVSIMGVSKISHAAPVSDIIWLGRASAGIVVERVAVEGESGRVKAIEARRERARSIVREILASHPLGVSARSLDTEASARGIGKDFARAAVEELLAGGTVIESDDASNRPGRRPRIYRMASRS